MLDLSNTKQSGNSETGQHQNVVYEGLAVRNRKAPLLRRAFAYLTDVAIVTAIMYFVGIILFVVGAFSGIGLYSIFEDELASKIGGTLFVIFIIFAVLIVLGIYSGYFVYNEYKTGSTLGKRIFGLRVISQDGRKLTVGQCVLRDMLRIVDCQLILPGFLAIRLSEEGKRLGDMVAGTLVIYSQTKEREAEYIYVQSDTYKYYYERLQPQPISKEDAKIYLHYAYNSFISLNEIAGDVAPFAKELARKHQTVPEDLSLSSEDLELFFAEFCNQLMIDTKGK